MTAGTSPNPDPIIGTYVGSYRVERLLGEGGMGAVYELLHPGIGKRVALKLLHAEYAARPQIVQRFFDEARSVNVIGHPNIVDIMDFAELPDGRRYILMEYLEGDSLAGAIKAGGPMASEMVAQIGVSICSALEAAHAAGIVHRDLKPENVHLVPRLDNPHYVKVLDFGIAKLSSDLHLAPGSATRSGVVMGTPSYMSPEQAMGRTKEIDHRTDVYALGIILYEMLVGEVPFSAESFGDLMLKHLQEPPQSIRQFRPDAPPSWNEVIQVALAKRREDRFQTMTAMAQAIRDAAAGRSITIPTAGHTDATMAMTAPTATPAHGGGGAGGGTMTYDQGSAASWPPAAAPQYGAPNAASMASAASAATGPGAQRASTAGTNSTVEPAGSGRKVFLVAALSIIAIATAVIIVFIVKGSGGESQHAALPGQPIDAGTAKAPPVVATADAAAATVATAPVPVAPVPVAMDAAVAVVREKPTRTKVRTRTKRKPRTKATGKVRIVVTPWAYIKINGKSYGSTPKTVSLPAGTHRLHLTNPELSKSTRKTLRIKPGSNAPININWE